jgi:hypothetical protein
VFEGGDDAGRMEGFVPAGPRLELKANARLGLQIKRSAQDGLLGFSWGSRGCWSFVEFLLSGCLRSLAFKGLVIERSP